MEHTDPAYNRANQVMDGREKFVFGECRKIAEAQSSEGADLHIDEHASYIVDLACALAYNTKEKMMLIVEHKGVVENSDTTAQVEEPCLVGRDGPQARGTGVTSRLQQG